MTTTLPTTPVFVPSAPPRSSRVLPLAILGAVAVVGGVTFGLVRMSGSARTPEASPAAADASVSAPPTSASPRSSTIAADVVASSAPLVLDASSAAEPASAEPAAAASGAPGSAQPVAARPGPAPAKSVDPRKTTFTPRKNPY